MNHLFDLNSLNDYTSFHDALANLAINSPEDLRNLLVDLPRVYLYNHSKNPYTHLYRRRGLMGMDGIEAISDDEAIERIVEESATRRPKANPKEQEHSSPFVLHRVSDVELAMYVLYENNAAEAIKFLVDHALPEVRTAFLNKFLPPEVLARQAEVKIVVRRNEGQVRGNRGRYLIFTQKVGREEQQLRLTNQASCVYYLMYLIDRYKRSGYLPPLDMVNNRDQFKALYRDVYDIDKDVLEKRISNLMFRFEDKRIRVGRLRELIYDIHTHMEDLFREYDEPSVPYVMTAYRHLEIDSEHIVFEDEALLRYNFL